MVKYTKQKIYHFNHFKVDSSVILCQQIFKTFRWHLNKICVVHWWFEYIWYITKVTTKLFLGNWQIINIKNLFCFILNLIVLLFQNSNLLTRKSQFHIRFGLTNAAPAIHSYHQKKKDYLWLNDNMFQKIKS